MPNDIAIRVENLGKRYVIGRETPPAPTFAGRLRQTAASPFSWLASQMRGPSEDEILWALKDVSFEVKRGEVLGVIGRNGAGKSTLLKILSRITEPTTGHAEIHGRVGALLEVGTGMHPELTGRENIYLNGTILGMRKTEIDAKFDEIVDFSGIERFLDTPVKRYSSGMRVRLGFAIAAHLEPEILIIDEVLAVGDAEFQKKCLGKMKDVAGHGRTVLFVSHQLDAVANLCTRGVMLHEGNLHTIGQVADVIDTYVGHSASSGSSWRGESEQQFPIQAVSARMLDEDGVETACFDVFSPICIEICYVVRIPQVGQVVNFVIEKAGVPICMSFDSDESPDLLSSRKEGMYTCLIGIPKGFLKEGLYSLSLNAGKANGGDNCQRVKDAISFNVELVSRDATFASYSSRRPGVVACSVPWKVIGFSDLNGNS